MSDQRKTGSCGKGFTMNAWWEEQSLPVKILAGIGMGILAVGLAALFGWAVMALWNWIMPDLFGLKRLDYWKAWGLLALCWILFKNWGSGGNRQEKKRKRQLRSYLREEPKESPPGS